MNEFELEVFRADEEASRGITSADIAAAAQAYDPTKAPAAICIGHPKSDTPAYGVIAKLRADGNRLFATIKDVKDKVVDGIKDGSLLNRSMAFFGKDHEANPVPGTLYPRHLGFLGASAPGIPGLKNIKKALAFSADDELEVDGDPAPGIVFESPREPTPTFTVTEESTVATEPTAEQLAADRKKLDDDRTAFEAERDSARKAGNKSLVDGLVTAGKITPAEAERLTPIFDALAPEPLEFEAGKEKRSPASELASLLATREPVVDVSGERKSPSAEFTALSDKEKKDPAKIEAGARALMKQDESLSFEAAVAKFTGQTADEE